MDIKYMWYKWKHNSVRGKKKKEIHLRILTPVDYQYFENSSKVKVWFFAFTLGLLSETMGAGGRMGERCSIVESPFHKLHSGEDLNMV